MKGRLFIVCLLGMLAAGCGTKGPLTMYPFEAPDPVADLKAVHRENVLTVSWVHSRNEKDFISGFVVERAEDSQAFVRVASLPPDVFQYEDRAFEPGKNYSYRVAAVSKRGRPSGELALLRVSPKAIPQPPEKLEAVATAAGVEIRWTPAAPDVVYNVYKSTSPGQCGNAPVAGQLLKEPRFGDGVDRTAIVYYCVRSLYGTEPGDEGFPSAELTVMPSIYVPAVVEGLRGVASRKGVQLIWRESPEQWVQDYRIYRKNKGDTDFRMVGEAIVPAWLDTETFPSAVLYAVEAVGPVSPGRRSPAILVTPFQEP